MTMNKEILTDVQTQIAKALIEMNSTVVEAIYTGCATATDDPVEIITSAVKIATNMTLLTLEDYAQLHVTCAGDEAGDEPWISCDRLNAEFDLAYAESINT